MDFISNGARLLFLKYALPCGSTLVRRGNISGKWLRDTIKVVSEGGKIHGRPETTFKIALKMCASISMSRGGQLISMGDVRRYFISEHDDVVERRYKMFGDFNTLRCRTYLGRVLKLEKRRAVIGTLLGNDAYRLDFCKGLRKGDYALVHRNFVVEKISERLSRRLWKIKESYFNPGMQK